MLGDPECCTEWRASQKSCCRFLSRERLEDRFMPRHVPCGRMYASIRQPCEASRNGGRGGCEILCKCLLNEA